MGIRVLVIGGAGFVGRRVVDILRSQDQHVTVFDSARQTLDDYVTGDITRFESLWEAFSIAQPEVVVQLAYLLGEESRAQPHLAAQVNVNGMNNVFEASRLSGVRRVVYASSVTIHGFQEAFGDDPVREGSRAEPRAAYAAMKLFNEQMAHAYADRYELEMIGLRFSNVFGHGRHTGSSGPWASGIVSKPAIGETAKLPVSPHFRASMIYVDDVAEYTARLTTSARPESPVFLTGGYDISVAELAAAVKQVIPDAEFEYTGSTANPGAAVPVHRVDNSLIVKETGHSLVPLAERIESHAAEARTESGV
jgi:nucleoside-diphosphate-sugar epimerase